jgi:hypothetical protein
MNTKTLLGIGGVAILAYILFRNKKKVEVSDLQKEPSNVIPAVVKNLKNQVLVSDLSSNSQSRTGIGVPIKVRRSRLILDQIKVPVKEPIIMNPINLIPNRYDRGVGQELAVSASGEVQGYYENMAGVCTEQIQKACKCTSEKQERLPLNIPQLP